MKNFNPEADRLKEARKAETLAQLRAAAAAPGAADRLTAATAEPDPVAVHLGILRQRFPKDTNLHSGWCPDLRSLADLAELAAYFSPAAIRERRRVEQHFREYFTSASPARRRQIEIETLGHPLLRRSLWSRLAFWRRYF